ncbi:MAG: winged helix-turn-helix domain-containing protein, partial [Paraglaciecola chathamensis]
MPESISQDQARKLVLHAQGLPAIKKRGKALTHTLDALESLGYVQIDTISAIERAHHHTLWNRNPNYHPSHLTQLVAQKHAFEYWSHAAAYLPMKDYRYSLPRKAALASGELDHWYPRNPKLMQEVLSRISSEGPLMAKDFETPSTSFKQKPKDWVSKPAKQALEYLFMQGELMIKERVNFHKVYELTERVLPESVDRSLPTEQENWHFLICRFLRANGLGQASEIAYLRKHTKAGVQQTINKMIEAGELVNIQVAGTTYVTLPQL